MATWAVIVDNEKVLLIKRSRKTSRSGQWCFPGGGIKENELPVKACIREIKEETGLDAAVDSLVGNIGGHEYYKCRLLDQEQEIKLKSNECDEYRWISPTQLLEVGIIMELKAVFQVLTLMGYTVELNDEARKIIS